MPAMAYFISASALAVLVVLHSSIVAIAGDGAYCTLSGTQTISGAKTFSGTVALGGSATATTPSAGDNDTSVATTAFVQGEGF